MLVEVCIIGVLLLANGFFAAAELAIVASSRHRLKALRDQGNVRAGQALQLAEQPEHVLATVQIGITLIGAFAAAFGGATIVQAMTATFRDVPLIRNQASVLALTGFTILLTIVQVIIGELVPKRLALTDPTRLACLVTPVLNLLQWIAAPLVWVMNALSNSLLRLIPLKTGVHGSKIDLQEIRQLMEIAAGQGVLDPVERHVAIEALHLGDQTVRQVMTPRDEMDAADIVTPQDEILGAVLMSGFSRLPVYADDLDHIVGSVNARDVMLQHYLGRPIELKKLLRPVYFVPETMRLDQLPVEFRRRKTTFAIVVDEHGRSLGIVTQEDVLDELVGEILAPPTRPLGITERPDGGWFVDGRTPIETLLEHLKWTGELPPRRVHTAAGLFLELSGRLPSVGDSVKWHDLRLEVVDMDGKRIDQLILTRDDGRGLR